MATLPSHPGSEQPRVPIQVRSHYRPRTPAGRVAVLAFVGLFALTQPPIVYAVANRISPFVLGLPFLYAYLLLLYFLLIGVLLWALRRGL